MNLQSLTALTSIFESGREPDSIFTDLMPALVEILDCDRCFLYFRDPKANKGRITHCYSRDPKWDDLTGADWLEESEATAKDPLMVIAFRTPEAVYIEDIETTGPETINLEYERDVFKHRALIHAPMYHDGLLYGILEPCVFEQPRIWTESDRQVTALVQEKLGPLAAQYLQNDA